MSQTMSASNRRIAKNTIFLYVRMLFTMGIGLVTSRVVLKVLGVDDFGVYNVVGGVVAMFGFINSSMSGATSRFLTYGLGKSDEVYLKKVFSLSLEIHIAISIIILILSETIGLWFLNNKLDIPPESMYAANWVYQCSVISAVISITQVPYNAAIIAHENMNVFAYVEILNSILKLVILSVLYAVAGNKLMIYGFLVLGVSFVVAFIYRFYCLKHYSECRFTFTNDRALIKPIFSFFGWDLYGNLSTIMRTQGVNMLINIFFGVVANTAYGIAMQVQGAVGAFSSNIITAVRPQIIKNYASGDYNAMKHLIYASSKYIFMLLVAISIPVIIEMDFLLKIWLGEVPLYSVWLCRLSIFFLYFSTLSFIMVTGAHATGKIKIPSLINGSIYLSVVPISYIAFKHGGSIYIPFICNAIFVFFGCCMNLYAIKRQIAQFAFWSYFSEVILRCALATFCAAIVPAVIYFSVSYGWVRLGLEIMASVVGVSVATLYIVSENNEREIIFAKIKDMFIKWKIMRR